ncbi:MAG TPA: DUF429 domain-containing protein [Burkholderiales bacterium]|nr:DUF429 domain-containing protein [Burkholderiales bacterium]
MRVLGVDFTSRPRRAKPIVCAEAELSRGRLVVASLREITDFGAFEALLAEPGPWVGGFDFPFGQPRALIEQLGWPLDWRGYVERVARLSREQFRALMDAVRAARPVGSKYLHRATDIPAGASSPMKLVNPPVGLMFYEGAPRLVRSGARVIPCCDGDSARIALEAYPGMLARQIVSASYKNDARSKQTPARFSARRRIRDRLVEGSKEGLGFRLELAPVVSRAVLEDGSGDALDAVLCAAQAGWAWSRRRRAYDVPADADPLEGWIAGPAAWAVR